MCREEGARKHDQQDQNDTADRPDQARPWKLASEHSTSPNVEEKEPPGTRSADRRIMARIVVEEIERRRRNDDPLLDAHIDSIGPISHCK